MNPDTTILAQVPTATISRYRVQVVKPLFEMKPGDTCRIVQVSTDGTSIVVERPDGRQIQLNPRDSDSFKLVRSHNTNLRTSPLHFYYIEFTY